MHEEEDILEELGCLTWIIEEPHLMTINKIVKVVDLSIQN
jgi:hypothetical protein